MSTRVSKPEREAMVIEQLRRCLETADWDALADVYAPDALLDANVPQWRFQRKGLEEIVDQYRTWYPARVRLVEWKPVPTAFGAVVQQADWSEHGDEELYARSLHVFRVDGGLVGHHLLYCTGQWHRRDVERHALEAPIYEP